MIRRCHTLSLFAALLIALAIAPETALANEGASLETTTSSLPEAAALSASNALDGEGEASGAPAVVAATTTADEGKTIQADDEAEVDALSTGQGDGQAAVQAGEQAATPAVEQADAHAVQGTGQDGEQAGAHATDEVSHPTATATGSDSDTPTQAADQVSDQVAGPSADQVTNQDAIEAAQQASDSELTVQGSPLSEGAYVVKPRASYGTALSSAGSLNAGNITASNVDGDYDQVFYFQSVGSGYYAIFSVASGLALDASGSTLRQAAYSGSNHQLFEVRTIGDFMGLVSKASRAVSVSGATASTGAYSGSTAQQFKLVEAPLVIPGTQVLRSATTTGSAISVASSSRSAGTKTQLASYTGTEGQKMTLTRTGAVYAIRPLSSGLDLAPWGSNVVQASGSWNWTPSFATSGSRRGLVFTSTSSGKAIQGSGSTITTAAKTGTGAQAFLPALSGTLIQAGYAKLQNAASGNLLDIAEGSWLRGGNIQVWSENGSGAQVFDIMEISDGVFRIDTAMTNYTLSVGNTNVYQDYCHWETSQFWVPIASRGGGIALINVATGQALAATGTGAGSNVETHASAKSALQGWTITPTSYEYDAVLVEAMRNAAYASSNTDYQILVDRDACRTIVVYYSDGLWRPLYNWTCTVGAPSTPTITGYYEVGIRGYSFDGAMGGSPYTCYYYTQILGDYLFHSIPYWQGTWTVQDGRLGEKLSHGCVRLAVENARWIYENIPSSTRVYIYN